MGSFAYGNTLPSTSAMEMAFYLQDKPIFFIVTVETISCK